MNDQDRQSPPSGHEQPRENVKQQQGERGVAGGGGGSSSSGGGRFASGGRRRFQNQPQHSARRPEASLNLEELRELVELITENGLTDFELEREGFRVRVRRDHRAHEPTPLTASTARTPPATPPSELEKAASRRESSATPSGEATASAERTSPVDASSAKFEVEQVESKGEELHTITSPIVGTFYRAPSPTGEPFVRAGSYVEPDTVVCIIEAMKLMNEIQAETTGVVEKVYVENGQPVEYGQPLFGIKK